MGPKATPPQIAPTVEMLKQIEFFSAFSDPEIEAMISAGSSNYFEPETNIVIEGELSWGLYLILDGTLGVYKTNKINRTIYEAGRLGKGNFFGEMSFFDESPRSATLKTITDCHLFHLSRELFNNLINISTDIKIRFYSCSLKALVKRLRELDDNYIISQYQLWQSLLKKEMNQR